jgi:hypothetical protein
MTIGDTPSGRPALRDTEQTSQPIGTPGPERKPGAREQIRKVRDKLVDHSKNTLRQAKDRATASLAEGRRETADQIGELAGAVHRASEHLRSEDQSRAADLAESAASQADRVADYLRDADLRKIGRDLEALARRQPVAVYGAAFAIGLFAARFLKSSDTNVDRDLTATAGPVAGME